MIVIVANPSTSIVAGFAVFSVLGHLAHEAGVPIEDITDSGKASFEFLNLKYVITEKLN